MLGMIRRISATAVTHLGKNRQRWRRLNAGAEQVMGVEIRKVTIPVAAGRNLAVLTEAAVRNYVLQLRGIDSTREFIERQHEELNKRD